MRARDNPFRSERLESVPYRLQGTTWVELIERLRRLRYRAAIVGRHGAGKTTLLENLRDRLHEQGFGTRWIRLDEEHRHLDPATLKEVVREANPNEIILFDGAEQMNGIAWWRFRLRARRAGGLIITTHRPGRLTTLFECRTSPALLADITAELLGVGADDIHAQTDALFLKHGGNIRDALRECYDCVIPSSPNPSGSGCGAR